MSYNIVTGWILNPLFRQIFVLIWLRRLWSKLWKHRLFCYNSGYVIHCNDLTFYSLTSLMVPISQYMNTGQYFHSQYGNDGYPYFVYSSPPLIRTPLLPRNYKKKCMSLLDRSPLVRGRITCIPSTWCHVCIFPRRVSSLKSVIWKKDRYTCICKI